MAVRTDRWMQRGIQCEKPGGTELLKVVWNIPVLESLCLWVCVGLGRVEGNG